MLSSRRYLDTVHQLRLSVGAIVSAIHRTAQRAQPVVARIVDRIRASPSGTCRRNGAGGRMATTATSGLSALRPSGTSCVVVGARRWWMKSWARSLLACWSATSTPPTTTTTVPNNAAGPICCETSTTLRALYPDDAPLARWADAVHGLYDRAKACTHPQAKRRRTAQVALERQLLAICQPFLDDPSATQAKLCRRIERHIKELFVFVAEPEAPADNNAAERSLRHLVVSRKISGGTRSEQGTESKMTLASIFGTWRAQGLNPLTACRQLLVSPLL